MATHPPLARMDGASSASPSASCTSPLAHSYRFRTTDANFSFGWEIGRIAYSLATGHGFSSPFGGDTGPSAWTAPVYPWIVSLAFRAFGTYSHAASFALLTFNSLCSALTAWAVYRTARKVFNENVALWSGWIWALLPYIMYWSVRWIWETSLTALLLSLGVHADRRNGRRQPYHFMDRLRGALGRNRAH